VPEKKRFLDSSEISWNFFFSWGEWVGVSSKSLSRDIRHSQHLSPVFTVHRKVSCTDSTKLSHYWVKEAKSLLSLAVRLSQLTHWAYLQLIQWYDMKNIYSSKTHPVMVRVKTKVSTETLVQCTMYMKWWEICHCYLTFHGYFVFAVETVWCFLEISAQTHQWLITPTKNKRGAHSGMLRPRQFTLISLFTHWKLNMGFNFKYFGKNYTQRMESPYLTRHRAWEQLDCTANDFPSVILCLKGGTY